MKTNTTKIFAADFETTVFEEQNFTEVWASALVELYTEKPFVYNNIEKLFKHLISLKSNVICYFHNLKFDGCFLLNELFEKYKIGLYKDGKMKSVKHLRNGEFIHLISNTGQFYNIKLRVNNNIIEFRDSLKLLPFSIDSIAKNFKTKYQKLSLDYEGVRFANGEIKPNEKEYIISDVMVLKEGLEIMLNRGYNKITIGACCLSDFKKGYGDDFDSFFPDLTKVKIDSKIYGSETAYDYIRKSYKGAWCYVVEEKAGKVLTNGSTYDANSLYSSEMHSKSGNYYPIGKPKFFIGNNIPDKEDIYYFIRVKTKFRIKSGFLPTIQIKNNPSYKQNQYLKTSDITNIFTNKLTKLFIDYDGRVKEAKVELTLTQTDYKLIKQHYDLFELEILDGCYFNSSKGLFDIYINNYFNIKKNSTNKVDRTIAKLFLNNLYGKYATSTDSSYKVAFIDENGVLKFRLVEEYNKKAGYIPIGSAITSYARYRTITLAQKNYNPNGRGFVYADTDSLHLDTEYVVGLDIDDKELLCWKNETKWRKGVFVRQKTYIEEITEADGIPLEEPQYNIVCAGMPSRCKKLIACNLRGDKVEDLKESEMKFMSKKMCIEDFKIGLSVPSKLYPKRISGGIVLQMGDYNMK